MAFALCFFMTGINWQRYACVIFCVIAAVAAFYFFIKYVLVILLPFLIGWGVSLLIRPLAKKLSAKTSASEKFWSVFIMLVLVLITALGILLLVDRFIDELKNFFSGISDNPEIVGVYMENISDYIQKFREKLPFSEFFGQNENLQLVRERLSEMLESSVKELALSITSTISEYAGAFVKALPAVFIFLFVSLISCFYFCMDLDFVQTALKNLFPSSFTEKLRSFKERAFDAAKKYFRAYLIIFLLTFCELFVGFCVLRIEYALLLAFLIALLDILPVFGAGTALIPWGIISLIMGEYYVGFGLLILYLLITLVRQVAEPKIIGESLGLHPLLTLFAIYIGFKLFGIMGMLIGPFVLIMAKALLSSKKANGSVGF